MRHSSLAESFRLLQWKGPIAGPGCADAIVRELPNARLVTIEDSGHFVYVEQPEAFRAALAEFLL